MIKEGLTLAVLGCGHWTGDLFVLCPRVSHLALCSGPGAQQDRGNKCVASKFGLSIHPENKMNSASGIL